MPAQKNNERLFFEAGAAKLKPLLASHGFEYYPGDEAVSSGGPFATGSFRQGELEIGLIVRDGDQMGCPNYSEGQGYAGHDDLFWALGRTDEAKLVPGEFLSYIARDGGDPFDAFLQDLNEVILPALQQSPDGFSAALKRAHRKFQRKLSGESG